MNNQLKEWLKINYPDFVKKWKNLPWAFKWGVYLEFFDTVGIEINIMSSMAITRDDGVIKIWEYFITEGQVGVWSSRLEAQKEVVDAALEILEA